MIEACATFRKLKDSKDANILICTAISKETNVGQFFDGPSSWNEALGNTCVLKEAVEEALRKSTGYPEAEAFAMRASLGWRPDVLQQLSTSCSSLRMNMDYESCMLLPEMTPININSRVEWLDKLTPIHRTIDCVAQRTVRRVPDISLAVIIYSSPPNSGDYSFFKKAEKRLQEQLMGRLDSVDFYRGEELTGSSVQYRLLQEIFLRHRAVLFLGHLGRDADQNGAGWQLTPDQILRISDLSDFIKKQASLIEIEQNVKANTIPEVVFANCCFSAGTDCCDPNLSYPSLFLKAGVRFFIGTSMDVIVSDETFDIIVTLAIEFFSRWAANPDKAVQHLYEAKRSCGNHLLTGLYQIYCPAGEQGIVTEGRSLIGALVSGILVGDNLDEYKLIKELWSDTYAKTFAAIHITNNSFYLVQILSDELQGAPGIEEALQTSVQKLLKADLGSSHLVPNHYQIARLKRNNKELGSLHILIYDRPLDEDPEDWSTLISQPFDLNDPGHFEKVLKLGAEISFGLAELHSKNILHGNFNPGSILLKKERDGSKRAVIKDTWMWHTQPGRCTKTRYAAPEEPSCPQASDALKHDCWGLGTILFELAAGRPPFDDSESSQHGLRHGLSDLVGAAAGRVPIALDRVIRECLVPSSEARPSAEFVARRLMLALHAGGNYVSDFEQELNLQLQAGRRLFVIACENPWEIEQILRSLASYEHLCLLPGNGQSVSYHLYLIAEERGMVDSRTGQCIVPWTDAKAFFNIISEHAAQNNQPPPPFPTSDEVGIFNAEVILGTMMEILPVNTPQEIPIVLIIGNRWWMGPYTIRLLKRLQSEPLLYPAVFVTDNLIILEAELARSFISYALPSPTPANLFEHILNFPGTQPHKIPDISAQTAMNLAIHFFPCSMSELKLALQMCALKFGAIDERCLLVRDEARMQLFHNIGTATYIPVSQLQHIDYLGLPDNIAINIREWAKHISNIGLYEPSPFISSTPQRILISAPSGCGKTALAEALAAQINRPLVRIDAAGCLRGRLGESEETLRYMLGIINSIKGVVVLLDDIDRFFSNLPSNNRVDSLAATFVRMSGIFLRWMDTSSPDIIIVLTATNRQNLPSQWRRRIRMNLDLPEPLYRKDPKYRARIFAGIFRRYYLNHLAENIDLLHELANRSDPLFGNLLKSPIARKAKANTLAKHTIKLGTSADIKAWIEETILFCQSEGSPEDPNFWQKAVS